MFQSCRQIISTALCSALIWTSGASEAITAARLQPPQEVSGATSSLFKGQALTEPSTVYRMTFSRRDLLGDLLGAWALASFGESAAHAQSRTGAGDSFDDPGTIRAGVYRSIDDLSLTTRALKKALDRYNTDLDNAIKNDDLADSDLKGIVQAQRKLFIARIVAAQIPVPLLAELREIKKLVTMSSDLIDSGENAISRVAVFSIKTSPPLTDKEWKSTRKEWLAAKKDATSLIGTALAVLAVDSAPDPEEAYLEFNVSGLGKMTRQSPPSPSTKKKDPLVEQLKGLPRDTPMVLFNSPDCRVILVNAGMDPWTGRHLFYQEQWSRLHGIYSSKQPPYFVLKRRKRVTVNAATGCHEVVAGYRDRQMAVPEVNLEAISKSVASWDILWQQNPDSDSTAPAMQEMKDAVDRLQKSVEAFAKALDDIKTAAKHSLAANDRKEGALDLGLPSDLRVTLYGWRACVSYSEEIQEFAHTLRAANAEVRETMMDLGPLAAWTNLALEGLPARISPKEGLDLQELAAASFKTFHELEADPLAFLPPTASASWTTLSSGDPNYIIRFSFIKPVNAPVEMIQDIWRWVPSGPSLKGDLKAAPRVLRTITRIAIDPETGEQRRIEEKAIRYTLGYFDTLTTIFENNSLNNPLGGGDPDYTVKLDPRFHPFFGHSGPHGRAHDLSRLRSA